MTTSDESSLSVRVLRESSAGFAAAAISLVAAFVALGLTFAELGQRWQVGGPDGILHYALFTSSSQVFSYANNGNAGFPEGLNAFFVSQIDVQSAVVMWLLSLVVPGGILAQNVFALLTFAAAGLSGYAFFRALRVRWWVALVFGVIFSLAPYHFIRVGYGHTFIANYWAVPLAGMLVLVAAGRRTDPFADWAERAPSRRGRLLRHAAPTVILALAVATAETYYFVFAVIVVGGVWAFSALTALVRRSGWRSLAWPTVAMVALTGLVGVNLFTLTRGYGVREVAYGAGRLVAESELYAGKLVSLVLPWKGTGIPGIVRATNAYTADSGVLQTTEAAGVPLIAAFGIVALGAASLLLVFSGSRAAASSRLGGVLQDARTQVLASATLWAFLFYIVTGLGVLVAMAVGPQIRTWGRMSIFLILFGLGFVAVLLDSLPSKAVTRFAAAAVLVVIAIADQLVGVSRAIPLEATADTDTVAFVAAADATLADGCGVVQLPLTPFPESNTVGSMTENEQALPFLYTAPGALRWSFGAIEGTTGWRRWAAVTGPADFAAAVRASGACAVSVNLDGYSADPDGWKPYIAALFASSATAADSGAVPAAAVDPPSVDSPAAADQAVPPAAVTSPSGSVLLFTVAPQG